MAVEGAKRRARRRWAGLFPPTLSLPRRSEYIRFARDFADIDAFLPRERGEEGKRERILCELSFSFFLAMARSRSLLVSSEEDVIIDTVLFLGSAADLSPYDNISHCVKMISEMILNPYEIYTTWHIDASDIFRFP